MQFPLARPTTGRGVAIRVPISAALFGLLTYAFQDHNLIGALVCAGFGVLLDLWQYWRVCQDRTKRALADTDD